MVGANPDKELAFMNDLFVATEWGERFAELVNEHVVLPPEGQVVYLGAGTGGHVIALQEKAGNCLKFLGIDENRECLELARAKAAATKGAVEFSQQRIDDLELRNDEFDLALADASLIDPQRVRKVLTETIRVVKPEGIVMLTLPTASSFGEFFSLYWEALYNCGLTDHEADVEALISELPTVSEIENHAEQEGLEEITSWTRVEEFDYESGEQFLNAPLISHFLMVGWLEFLPEDSRERVTNEIARLVDEDRHAAEFALSVKATLIVGRKSRSN